MEKISVITKRVRTSLMLSLYLVKLEARDPSFGHDELDLLGDGLRAQGRQVRHRLVPPVGERVPCLHAVSSEAIGCCTSSCPAGARHHPPLIPDKLGRLLRRSDDGAGDEAGRVDEHDVAGVESGGGGRRWREEVKKGRVEQGDKRWRVWWRWEKVAPVHLGWQ